MRPSRPLSSLRAPGSESSFPSSPGAMLVGAFVKVPESRVHDDAEREFDVTAGDDQALARARADGWTIACINDDWITVF